MRTIVFELVCVASLVAFAMVVWWPAALLVVGVAAAFAAWNQSREEKK